MGVELYREELHIRYIADYSELPSLQWFLQYDIDDDGVVSEDEMTVYLDEFAAEIVAAIEVQFDAQPVPLSVIRRHGRSGLGDQGLLTLRVEVLLSATGFSSPGHLEVRDLNFLSTPGWRTYTLFPSEGTEFTANEEVLTDPSQGLRIYPEVWKSFPPLRTSLDTDWNPATGLKFGATAEVDPLPAPDGEIRAVSENRGLLGATLGVLTALLLGFVDSLGPGHGKTVVASYFAGTTARRTHALAVAGLSTLTHALVAVVLGVLAATASSLLLPPVFNNVQLFAGIAAICTGSALLLYRLFRGHSLECTHAAGSAKPRRGVIAVGILGGLIPCPGSIALMLSAVSLGSWTLAVLLAISFSIGTGAALLLVGVASMAIRRFAVARGGSRRFSGMATRALPVLSACLIIAAGGAMIHMALRGPAI